MPSAFKSVRVIAKKQRELRQPGSPLVPLAKTEHQIEREIAQTVASWIDERRGGAQEFVRFNSAPAPLRSKLKLNLLLG
jgi:hypothetical protein